MTSKPKLSRAKRKPAPPSAKVLAIQTPVAIEIPKPATWISKLTATHRIAIVVGVIYFSLSFFTFRHVIANIPLVLSGEAVINGDELVPFFNPDSQLIDQAAGKFNQLTNGDVYKRQECAWIYEGE